jgi:hypothetical protein
MDPLPTKEKHMRRLMIGIAALAIPVVATTAGTLAIAGPAGAAAPVSCTKVTGTITGTVTLKGCGGGLGKGTTPAASLTSGGTITWKGKGKGTTTIGNVSVTTPATSACKAGSTEYDLTGTVTADTTAMSSTMVGSAVSARACVDGSGNISLVKHTVASL